MQPKRTNKLQYILAAASVAFALGSAAHAADATSASAPAATATPTPAATDTLAKPSWLSDLALGDTESYDDNVLIVSGKGLKPQDSWVNDLSFKIGFNIADLLGKPAGIQTFTVAYVPDKVWYSNASQEDYTAHRFVLALKAKSDDWSVGVDESFLYNDGNKLAETYALNQLSGAAANQNDKYRNNYSHAVARERRNQDQDRYNAFIQYDQPDFFFRPVSTLTFYKLNTLLFNTSKAPYEGYQDYIDRYDVNAGADLGYKLAPNISLVLGYRDGYQNQAGFAPALNSDQHYSSNHYQRLLGGIEGKPLNWLSVKLALGPDFRDYNPNTPISDLHTTRFYGEGVATATLAPNQSLSLNYKQWYFVSSTGLVPYEDITYALTYHWSATPEWGLDLGAKYLEANYTLGDDLAGSAPSLRDDLDYALSLGVTYNITKNLIASVGYNYDKGENGLSTLAAKYQPYYRDFLHDVTSVGLKYKF
jgi:hypothetical protein